MSANIAATTDQIVFHIQQANAAALDAVTHAIAAGELLAQVKAVTEHGAWLPYLATLSITARQAQRFMRVAAHREQLGNATRETHLSLRDALARIAQPQPKTPPVITTLNAGHGIVYQTKAFVAWIEPIKPADNRPAGTRYWHYGVIIGGAVMDFSTRGAGPNAEMARRGVSAMMESNGLVIPAEFEIIENPEPSTYSGAMLGFPDFGMDDVIMGGTNA